VWATIQALSKQLIPNELLTKEFRHVGRVALFPNWEFALQVVEEVFQEDDVVMGLLRSLGLDARNREHRRQAKYFWLALNTAAGPVAGRLAPTQLRGK
jgi:hypothetical protein